MKRDAAAPIPLARLLALAYRQMIDELHTRLARTPFDDVRPTYGYVLLSLSDESATGADIAALLGVTKQAASKLLETMEAGGYVKRQPHSDDARAKSVAITAKGRRVLETVESIYRDLEAEWAGVTSQTRVESMRADLRRIVEASNGGQLPMVRPTR